MGAGKSISRVWGGRDFAGPGRGEGAVTEAGPRGGREGERSGQVWERILKAAVTGLAYRLDVERASQEEVKDNMEYLAPAPGRMALPCAEMGTTWRSGIRDQTPFRPEERPLGDVRWILGSLEGLVGGSQAEKE